MTPQQYLAIVRTAHQLELMRLHYAAMLRELGLDPNQPHRYDDATLTITAAEPNVPE